MKKKKLASKALAAALAAALAVVPGAVPELVAAGSSSTDDLQKEIDELKAENEKRKKELNSLSGDISENKEAIKVVEAQIDGVNLEIQKYGELVIAKQENIEAKSIEIENVEKSIEDREREIEIKKAEIVNLQKTNNENLKRFSELARILYMNDASGTMPVLNGSKDWYDYFVYSDVVRNISEQNLQFMERLLAAIKDQEQKIEERNSEIDRLEAQKEDLVKQKAQLEDDKDALESSRSELELYAAQQKDYLSSLVSKNKTLQNKVNSLEYDIKKSNKKLDELNEELEELIRREQEKNQRPVYSTDGFRWPISAKFQKITTYFGYDPWRGGNHGGIDVAGNGIAGASIFSAQNGTVIKVVNDCKHNYGKYYSCGCGGGWGNYVIVDHGGGVATLYAHMNGINVKEGQDVTRDTVLGYVGTTGWSTGYHLHFEVRVNGVRVNPFNYNYEYFY